MQESMVWKVLRQLLLALQECHKKRDGVHKVWQHVYVSVCARVVCVESVCLFVVCSREHFCISMLTFTIDVGAS